MITQEIELVLFGNEARGQGVNEIVSQNAFLCLRIA